MWLKDSTGSLILKTRINNLILTGNGYNNYNNDYLKIVTTHPEHKIDVSDK